MKPRVLIVEDQFVEANNLRIILRKAGYHVTGIARSAEAARKQIAAETPDFVLIDIFLNGPETGIDLAHELKKAHIPFLYLSANSNRTTLEAAKITEPYGFLVKPFREKDVLIMLEIATYQHTSRTTIQPAKATNITLSANTTPPAAHFPAFIGNSQPVRQIIQQIQLVAPADTTVLLLGQSGTGKERAAEIIHNLSPRQHGPFIKVNCAAIPADLIESTLFGHEKGAFTGAIERLTGKFGQAHNGTLFLDEIAEMSITMQSKLLRALQEKEIERLGSSTPIKVNVRVIAATNRNLEQEISEKRFRMDLYYRLNVFPITLPTLKSRGEDIPLLAQHFINRFCSQLGKQPKTLSKEAISQLSAHPWPGNVRELEHAIERTVLLSKDDVIKQIILPDTNLAEASPSVASFKTMAENEREHIMSVLQSTSGKVAGPGGAAEILGLPVSTLNARIKKLGIQKSTHYR